MRTTKKNLPEWNPSILMERNFGSSHKSEKSQVLT